MRTLNDHATSLNSIKRIDELIELGNGWRKKIFDKYIVDLKNIKL